MSPPSSSLSKLAIKMAEEGREITGIRHIFRLREVLQKWQVGNTSSSSSSPRRSEESVVRVTCEACDSDEDSCHGGSCSPPDVPKGCFAVYVGPEHRRFVIPTSYLGLPVFKVLLDKAEEEFGFEHQGAITFPCEIETFKFILQAMEKHRKGLIDDDGNPIELEERPTDLPSKE